MDGHIGQVDDNYCYSYYRCVFIGKGSTVDTFAPRSAATSENAKKNP